MTTSKTKYIGIGTSIVTVSALIVWMIASPDFAVTTSPDSLCAGTLANPCISFINVTFKPQNPLVGVFYLYNKEKVKLDFSPEIKNYALCKKDARYKQIRSETNLCGAGYREILISPYSSGVTYIYKFTKNIKEEWVLVGLKNNPDDEIKWGVTAIDKTVDPVWFAEPIEICKNVVIRPAYTQETYRTAQILEEVDCNKIACTKNASFITLKNGTTYTVVSQTYQNGTITTPAVEKCLPIGVVKYANQTFAYQNFFCKFDANSKNIYCYHCLDGRCQLGEGQCMSGETCISYNIISGKNTIYNSIHDKLTNEVTDYET